MTAKELRALLKAERLCREDLALFLGVDPKKPAGWERGEQPITKENAQQIHKALAEFREARASLQACGLWMPSEERAADGDYASARGGADEAQPETQRETQPEVGDFRGLRERAGEGLSTLNTAVRAVDATLREPRAARGRLFALWGALRSSFL